MDRFAPGKRSEKIYEVKAMEEKLRTHPVRAEGNTDR